MKSLLTFAGLVIILRNAGLFNSTGPFWSQSGHRQSNSIISSANLDLSISTILLPILE
jgi:hypothetical protein